MVVSISIEPENDFIDDRSLVTHISFDSHTRAISTNGDDDASAASETSGSDHHSDVIITIKVTALVDELKLLSCCTSVFLFFSFCFCRVNFMVGL